MDTLVHSTQDQQPSIRNSQACRCLRAKRSILRSVWRSKRASGFIACCGEILAAANETGPELKIREDNQSCIKMTKNPVNHGRAKHIDIKYHHIRDEVKRG
ncbi:hypothetical protein Pcac1_g29332 [Phytophthora cactorum]|nr:hypothetical protein Pcac1_g29332 [Phytophthora cactorum]